MNSYVCTVVQQHCIVMTEQTKLDNGTLKNVQRCNRVEIGKWHMKARQQLGKLQRVIKVMACKIAVLKLHMQRQR